MRSLRRLLLCAVFSLSLKTVDLQARTEWVTFNQCQYLNNLSNDGDSFHVRAGGKEYVFRLYFVDSPETDAAFPARVQEQATYFGVTSDQALKIGEAAKNFTREKLGGGFTVRTSMQNAMGQSRIERFYAFVQTSEGDLAELLVQNGLARIHGVEAQPVGLSNAHSQTQRLENLEREAKLDKRGGWGINAGRLYARAQRKAKQDGSDWFNQFFHPAVAANAEPVTTPTPATRPLLATPMPLDSQPAPALSVEMAPNGEPKLDINTASAEELKSLPGVGEVTAARIMAARPYTSADFLTKVKGIGPKKYTKLRPYFQ